MATRGQTIYNPVTHERITFVRTTEETGGKLLVFDCYVTPGGTPLPPHVHANQEERFEILSGTLGVTLGGKRMTLGPGERAILPARITHQWWNAGKEPVLFRVEVSPARNLERILEASAALAQAGKMTKRAMPRNPLVLAQFGKLSETYLPGIPIWMQRLGLSVGAATGRLLGFDPSFTQYVPTYEHTASVEAVA